MTTIDEIIDRHPDSTFTKLTGFDEAIIGVDEVSHTLVYCKQKIIAILTQRNTEWNEQDVWEWYDYNVLGSVMGEGYPRIVEIYS